MTEQINMYCDESCHLEHDGKSVMVLGAMWCPELRVQEISSRIKDIKENHGLPKSFEAKWVKVSPGNLLLYQDLLNYFFDDDDLHLRALIVCNKGKLNHAEYQSDHNTWYYKMLFHLISPVLDPEAAYHIYLDIKDTKSAEKVRKLHEVLCNDRYDFNRGIIQRVQTIRSHESQILQLNDLLIGALGYINRGLDGSKAKMDLVSLIQKRSHYSLRRTTLLRETKMNLLFWSPKELVK